MDELLKIVLQDRERKKGKYIARKYYYKKQSTAKKEGGDMYKDGKIVERKRSNKSHDYTNFFKKLVDQKINYILSKNPTYNLPFFDTEKFIEMVEEMALFASTDTVSWLHLYNENNRLDWLIIPDDEIIAIKDKYKKNIVKIIRYFTLKDENQEGKNDEKINVEEWTKQGIKVTVFDGNAVNETYDMPHYNINETFGNAIETKGGDNFPFIPFIPLYNNRDKTSDIFGIQDQLETYDMVVNGFISNIKVFQEAIMKWKGFVGTKEFFDEAQRNVELFKMVALPDPNSDVDYVKVDIPVEARQAVTEIVKDNIFELGNGLDRSKLIAGGQYLNNTFIKMLYQPLDMKANGSIKQLAKFYAELRDKCNIFYNTSYNESIVFHKTMLFNESEKIDDVVKSEGFVSKRTCLENHPWVDDVEEELKRIEEESTVNEPEPVNPNNQLL